MRILDKGEEMDRIKALKHLFEIQSIDEKMRIINEYGITIDGFSNVNTITIRKNEKIINAKAISNRNLKNIIKEINIRKKAHENSLEIFLSSEKIINKYDKDWDKIIQIFEQDEYGAKTIEILKSLTEHSRTSNEILEPINDQEQEDIKIIDKQREIIVKLENDIKIKDQKRNKVTQEIFDLESKMNNLNKAYKKVTESNKNIIDVNKKLKLENEKLKMLVEKKNNDIKKLDIEYNKLFKEKKEVQKDNEGKAYIFGSSLRMREELIKTEANLVFIEEEEISKFFDIAIRNQDEVIFYKYGITISILYSLRKTPNYKEFQSMEKMSNYLKENYI